MMKIKIILLFLIMVVCSCGDTGDNMGSIVPGTATLVFPLNDEVCHQGVILSEQESEVTFEWNAAELADQYTLSLTNLNTSTTEIFNTDDTQLDIVLLRGTPYSWKVTSQSNSTHITSISEIWRLFNAGLGIENYAPFPAELVNPPMGLSLSATHVDLMWKGSDADGDITEYEVYMDSNNPPATLLTTTGGQQIEGVTLQSETLYYWQVITKDTHNNETKSPVFEFRTQ